MPEDLDKTGSTSEAEDNDPAESNSKTPVDYQSKYRGEAKRAANLDKKLNTLQNQYDETLAKLEEAESKVRVGSKDSDKKLSDLQNEKVELEKKYTLAQSQLAKNTALMEARKTIRKDFAPLTDMLDDGDLKLQDEFSTPEEYQAYLKRMLARVAAQKTETPTEQPPEEPAEDDVPTPEQLQLRRYTGTTPRVPTNTRDGKAIRTVAQITSELWAVDTKTVEGRKKFAALEAEMNTAMANEGIRLAK